MIYATEMASFIEMLLLHITRSVIVAMAPCAFL